MHLEYQTKERGVKASGEWQRRGKAGGVVGNGNELFGGIERLKSGFKLAVVGAVAQSPKGTCENPIKYGNQGMLR